MGKAENDDRIYLLIRQTRTRVKFLEKGKCVGKEKSQNGTTSVGSDLSLPLREVTPYLSTSRHSRAVIAGRA